ncbi:cysteine-rich DPF motif domain-containing protein 1 isoform X1 [Rhineura floridana]|uniref:cysteine-rich DPF motif domain-containing protein 1 isoform X1 n=1 Tax=Rhineura floridana TaxID=261503 RepID=UPI002AC7FC6A|nr:cysteine-rich DPF motif domain-containing protein 1 isoform X1 [Rhineura floridana]
MRRCSPCGPLWTSSESAECLHLHALQVFQASLFLAFGLWHSQMESNKERQRQGTFECELCGLTAPYSYYGRKPPNASSVVLLEESYVMKDPFTSDKDKFLILGSQCSLCCKRLCVGTDCSLFYTKRFCLPCVNLHLKEFPLEIRKDLEKKSHSKSQSSKKEDSKISKKN